MKNAVTRLAELLAHALNLQALDNEISHRLPSSTRSRRALKGGAQPTEPPETEFPEDAPVEFHAAALDGRCPGQAPADRLERRVAAPQPASADE
jgi:hypothetical protein